MSMRVTPTTMNRSVMTGLQANLARLQRTQEQLSSGRRTQPPLRLADRHGRRRCGCAASRPAPSSSGATSTTGSPGSGSADSTLTQASSIVLRVRQLLVAGQNGTNGPTERAAMAGEVDELRSLAGRPGQHDVSWTARLRGDAERDCGLRHDDRGVPGERRRRAAQRLRRRRRRRSACTLPGPEVFSTLFKGAGADPGVLKRISAALRSGDTAAMNTGARRPRPGVADDAERAEPGRVALQPAARGPEPAARRGWTRSSASLATTENIDLPKTIIDMQIQQTAYQAALGSTAKIIQPSLVDFLR